MPVRQDAAAGGLGEEEEEGRISSFTLRSRWKSDPKYYFIAFLLQQATSEWEGNKLQPFQIRSSLLSMGLKSEINKEKLLKFNYALLHQATKTLRIQDCKHKESKL